PLNVRRRVLCLRRKMRNQPTDTWEDSAIIRAHATTTTGLDKHLAHRPASQLRGIVLMAVSTDATQEGGRHGTIRSDRFALQQQCIQEYRVLSRFYPALHGRDGLRSSDKLAVPTRPVASGSSFPGRTPFRAKRSLCLRSAREQI